MEKNTKTFALEDDPKISEMPKSEDEQRRQNEDYARNLGLLDYRLYPNTSHIHPHMCG